MVKPIELACRHCCGTMPLPRMRIEVALVDALAGAPASCRH
ncbi:MAG: hypothetical protein ACRER2_09525 [Methylococcales bacterium]